MNQPVEWRHTEFARVISCTRCTSATDSNLLRDNGENVPQPGYIGPLYRTARVLLVGRNPGTPNSKTPKSLAVPDRAYTASLRTLRMDPTLEHYKELTAILKGFIPRWPIANYFPLAESNLALEDIAYCNIVRCRTKDAIAPSELLAQQCVSEHFVRWLNLLAPRIVVFVNKTAWSQGRSAVDAKGIPCTFMNGKRSLSPTERAANRAAVVALIRQHCG